MRVFIMLVFPGGILLQFQTIKSPSVRDAVLQAPTKGSTY